MAKVSDMAREATTRRGCVLIVEDERLLRWSLRERLAGEGFKVLEVETGEEALAHLEAKVVDLVLLDYKLPGITGLEVFKVVREKYGDIPVIMMTAYSTVERAVEAMRMGVFNYLTKPFDLDELVVNIEKAMENTALRREVARLREAQRMEFGVEKVIAASEIMRKLFKNVLKIAQSPAVTVLLTGESGVGKDLLAKAIHDRSGRSDEPFMNVTCTTITASLLESELFGHERGAFTDAKSSKKGLFELSDGGTVFLDEIGDMPPALQAKLLRFLQDKTFKRVGGTDDITVDVRIIAATNKNLEKLVEEGAFREDLYYRLNVIPLAIPPLRERASDVPLLAQHFVDVFNRQFRKELKGIKAEALDQLAAYGWPGNVRELKNVIERAMILGEDDWIGPDDLPFGQRATAASGSSSRFMLPPEGIRLDDLERDLVEQALRRSRGVKTRAGALLGINRDQIRYRMEKFGIVYDPKSAEG